MCIATEKPLTSRLLRTCAPVAHLQFELHDRLTSRRVLLPVYASAPAVSMGGRLLILPRVSRAIDAR